MATPPSSFTGPSSFEEAGYPPETVEKLSQLHAVFDYYDTDRDGKIDRRTMRKMCDLIGFRNPSLPTSDAIGFDVFANCVMAMEAQLGKGGEVRRAGVHEQGQICACHVLLLLCSFLSAAR